MVSWPAKVIGTGDSAVLKRLAWLVSAILAVVIGVATVLVLSDRTFFALVDRLVPAFTPYRLTLEDPHIHWREGRLEVGTLQVHQEGNDGAPLLGIDRLSVNASLVELFEHGISRADISAGAVLVYVDATDSSEDPNPAEWLQYTSLFPRKLSVGTLHVVSQDTSVSVFPFSNLYGGWQDSSHFVASAGADYTGRPLILALSVERRELSSNSSSLAIHGALKPQQGSSRIELDGQLTATEQTVTYRFDLHAEYERVQDFLNAIEDGAYPFSGTLILDGTLEGDLEQYDLEVRQLSLDNGDTYFFTASGSVSKPRDDVARLSFSARGRMASADQLLDVIDFDIGQIGEASAELRLTGPLTEPVLEEFTVRTRNNDGLELSVTPHAGTFGLQQRELMPGQELAVSLSAPALAALEPWVGELPLEPGAWRADLRLAQVDEAFRLKAISLDIGDSDAMQARFEGSIESLRWSDATAPSASGIALDFQASSTEAQSILPSFMPSTPGLPSVHTAHVSGRLRGTLAALRVVDTHMALTGDEFLLEMKGLAAELHPARESRIAQAEADIALTLTSVDPLNGLAMPEAINLLDAGQLHGRASYTNGRLALSNLSINAQALDGTFRVRGTVGDVLNMGDLALDISVQGMPLARVAAAVQGDQPHAATASLPGRLSGSARLSGDRDSLAIEGIDIALAGGESAGATLQGHANRVAGDVTAQIEGAYRLDNRDLIASLTGQPLAPGSGTVVLDYQSQRVVVVLHSLMGDSDISAVLDASRSGDTITALDIDLNVPRLYLPDVLGAPEPATLRGEDTGGSAGSEVEDALAWRHSLPAYPLRIEAKIGEIVGDNSALEGFTFKVAGEDRRYILENFDIDYAGGSAAFRGVADLAAEKLGISLAGSADALPITAVAADLGYAGDIEGTLSVLAGLTAQGDSLETLVGSLSGRMAAAVADGHIEGAAYDLLATDLLGWLLSGGLLRDATDFHCAAVNFNLREGRANSDRLYILTRNMIASGNATVDLAARHLDIRVQPRARKRSVQMPSSITVRGALDDPTVSISPIAATMDTTAKILFFVPDLLLRLFGLGPDAEGRVQSCTVDG